MKKSKIRSINARIFLIITVTVVVMSTVSLVIAGNSLKTSLYNRVHEQLIDNSQSGLNLVDKMYPGDWRLEENQLYKGNKLINDSTEVVDSIHDTVGIVVTIFSQDTRVSTNIKENGKRILGTKAQEKVVDTVINKGEQYIGSVKIMNKDYEAVYVPIKDNKGKTIGMFFVGEESKFITEELIEHLGEIVLVNLLILAIAIVISTIITRKITKRIKLVAESMVLIGNGDFTVKTDITANDETKLLADAQNKMAEDLRNLVISIRNICGELLNSADTLAATSEETTATGEEIARALNEISGSSISQSQSSEEGLNKTLNLSENIQKVSESIQDIIKMFVNASNLNKKGQEIVVLLGNKTEESGLASEKVSNAINQVEESSQAINVIMNTITEIASQTNLLSLNASIEAARAGDAGKGFSVVALEIRKLAEQSAKAANEIRDIIKNVQINSKKAVDEMNVTKLAVSEQNQAVNQTKGIFNEISSTISNLEKEVEKINELNSEMVSKKNEIVDLMQDISASSQESSAATEEIAASSQQQVAGMEDVAKTAEQLNSVAQTLSEKMKEFKI